MEWCVHMWKPSLDLQVLSTPLLAAIIPIVAGQVQLATDDEHAGLKLMQQVDKQI